MSKSVIPLGLSVSLHKSYIHPAVLICAANLLLPWLAYYFAGSQGKVLFHSFHSWQYCSARQCGSYCGLSRERAGICCPGMTLAHIPFLWDRGRCNSRMSLQNVVSNAGKTVVYFSFGKSCPFGKSFGSTLQPFINDSGAFMLLCWGGMLESCTALMGRHILYLRPVTSLL